MAKENQATRSRLDTIKTEIRTVSTCTTTTVAKLQELLVGSVLEPSQKENVRTTARRKADPVATATREDAKQPTPSFTQRERYVLATEVANITLKTLADALKTNLPAQVQPSTKAKPPRPRPLHTKSHSTAHPLKERSVSQMNNSPRKSSSLRRSSSYSSFLTPGPDAGLVATAECARIAFAYLGTTEAAKIAGKDSPALQLETGILSLVGKLVAHGLDNLAVKEMRILKRRLDKYLLKDEEKQDMRPKYSRPGSQQSSSAEKESLAALLDFGDVDRKSVALPIITNLQTYALRVIARVKRPRIIESTFKYLKLSHPSSPANLICHVAKSAENPTKTARQLESLAQTILHLCPSISSSDDDNQPQVSPDVVLCLQHLAFRVRQRWWSLTKHQGDKERDLLEPFSKCLVAFSRRSQLSPIEKYKLGESLYADLKRAVEDAQTSPSNGSQLGSLASQTLSSLAQNAELPEEALRHLNSSGPLVSESSTVKQAARLARIANISLQSCLKSDNKTYNDDTIAAVLNALATEQRGTATDLTALFVELNALRRIATRFLSTNPPTTDWMASQTLQQQCFRMVTASIRFTLRFIGDHPPAETHSKSILRHQECCEMAWKVVKSTVDSVLVCCKLPLSDEPTWNELDALLQSCSNLLLRLEEQPQKDRDNDQDFYGAQYPLVKFSNAYWAIQSQLRKLGVEAGIVATAMQRSTQLLQTRSLVEKEAGLLSMKLERLGEALDQLNRPSEARDAYMQCIQSCLTSDLCQEVINMAAKDPVQRIFEGAGPSATLGRVLKLYHRSFAKYGLRQPDEFAFFDNDDYPTPVRGVILEWQLALYQKTLSRTRQWDSGLNTSVQILGERVLVLYTNSKFPLRRQRVYLAILQLSQAHPDVLPNVSIHQAENSNKVEATSDCGLGRFASHLGASLKLKLSIQNNPPSVLEVQHCVGAWGSIVDSATSWDALTDKVDNAEYWLQDMQASIDFLAAKGEEYASLPVMHLVVKVLELRASSDSSELVASLCSLGLQLLRLGYSGRAGLAFAKAEVLISSTAASTESKLHWHLAYAEYLLHIGNVAQW
jgi:separase